MRRSSRHATWVLAELALTSVLVSAIPLAHIDRAMTSRVISPPIAYDGESWFVLQRSYPTGRMPPADALARAVRDARPNLDPRLLVTLPGD